jgi:hypothetical protein
MVIRRTASGIAEVIERYRAGDLSISRMVDGIETWIGSMIGSADRQRFDEWRRNWNRLEYVNASMIDEEREHPSSDELQMSNDALDAFEAMTRT